MNNPFICTDCDFITTNKKDYKRHLLTKKHIKKCKTDSQSVINNESAIEIIKKLVSNQEILTQILNNSQNNLLVPINNITNNTINTTNNTNNIQNNHFNLGIFLNEHCKDAMNLSEFINQIEISNDDLENIGKNGFVYGISEILNRNLEECGIYKRPMHCTDLKRETIHIKEDGVWKKDNFDNSTIKGSIEKIGDKCYFNVNKWMTSNPRYKIMDTEEYNLWIKIAKNTANSGGDELKNYNNIIKNIASMTYINNLRKNYLMN